MFEAARDEACQEGLTSRYSKSKTQTSRAYVLDQHTVLFTD